jgi:hypothetical protein
MLLCAALAAAGAWVLPVAYGLSWLRYVVLALGVGFILVVEYQVLHAAERGAGQGLLMPAVTMLVACALLWMNLRMTGMEPTQPWGILAALGTVWIVLAAPLLNRSSLRRAAWAHSQREIPAGTRRGDWRAATVGRLDVVLLRCRDVVDACRALAKDGVYCYDTASPAPE